jgi:hypothetical protein
VISAASPPSSKTVGAGESGSDYFATEAHYLSIAGRIVAALQSGGNFALVTSDPPASPDLLSEALRNATGSRQTVIGIPRGPKLTEDEPSRSGSIVATLPAMGGTVASSETNEPTPPLFIFDEVDSLSEQQIKESCEAVQFGARKGAAAVLLARPSFLARLEDPSLLFLKTALAARFRFDEVGEDEGIDFLRHRLATRHHGDAARGISPGVLRGLAVFGVLSTLGIGALVTLYYISTAGVPSAGMPIGIPATREDPAALSLPKAVAAKTAPAAAPSPAQDITPPQITAAKPVRSQPARVPEPTASVPTAGPPSDAATPQSGPQAPSPAVTQSTAGRGLSPAESAALVTRGDGFLSSGDIVSARLFYERAADAGDGSAALRLGATFDPGFLGRAGIRGAPGDPAQAASWYRRARDLGEAAAADRLKNLDRHPSADSGPSPH